MARQKKTLVEVIEAWEGCGVDTSQYTLMPAPSKDPERPDSYFLMSKEDNAIVLSNIPGSRLLDVLTGVCFVSTGQLQLTEAEDCEEAEDHPPLSAVG